MINMILNIRNRYTTRRPRLTRFQRVRLYLSKKLTWGIEPEKIVHQTVQLDPKPISVFLRQIIHDPVLNYGFSRKGVFLLGQPQMKHLSGEIASHSSWAIDMPADMKYYAGMRLICVPWMDGALFVPDELLNGER